jgi:beta-glucosidase
VSDLAIVVLGERSGLTDDSTTGEFRDRRGLGLLGRQQELLEAVVATGTPTVLIVVSGRPLALEWAAEHCAAILFAWVPGDEGPEAIADLLTGEASPGGKLPVTIPRDVGQVPLTYRHHPSGGRSQWKGDYVDGPVSPLWPFGHGLSYTAFDLSGLRLESAEVPTEGGELRVSVEVANTGDRAGDEVVSCTHATRRRRSPGRCSRCAVPARVAGTVNVGRSPSGCPSAARLHGRRPPPRRRAGARAAVRRSVVR